jgi:regulator of sirC expression with transglutaminase-like and TPR domain
MADRPAFSELAAEPGATLDLLALALAAEFRPVDHGGAIATLDALGDELARIPGMQTAESDVQARACGELLGAVHRFEGDREHYDDPQNSMLDLVLSRRRGLPILLSVVYVEVARRAGVALGGIGLPGHFVVGHFGADPPLLLDPFAGGGPLVADVAPGTAHAWSPHEIAMRILNNLIASFDRRGDLTSAIRAAAMRLELPAAEELREPLELELRSLHSRLN